MTAPAILSYGRPRRRRARVPLLFNARDCEDEDGIFALSYGKRVGLVHTRAGATGLATMADATGRLVHVPSDWPRLSWEMTSAGERVRALLGEPARTNLVLRSEEFDNASWAKSGVTVTANQTTAPDGAVTMDLLTSAGAVSSENVRQVVTVTGDGTKCFSVFLKQGTASLNSVGWFDQTAVTMRARVNVTWTAGIPSVALVEGSGAVNPVEYWFGDGWRIGFSAQGVLAASVNDVRVYPVGAGTASGAVYAWGAQAEDAAVPSSYIPTVGATVTRAADVLNLPYLAAPQEMTAYVRGVNRGAYGAVASSTRVLHIGGSSALALPRFSMGCFNTGGHDVQHDTGPGAAQSLAAFSVSPTLGTQVEHRAPLSAAGAVQSHVSVDAGAEQSAAVSAASTLAAAWSDTKVHLAGHGESASFAFQAAIIDYGTQELDELRELVEVA